MYVNWTQKPQGKVALTLRGCYLIGVNPLPAIRQALPPGYGAAYGKRTELPDVVWSLDVGPGYIYVHKT